ncbi:MAG: SdpI family protein [Patescibacteria group bacterium]|nr:SdpI family protein [Patescibacteria group bacterium]
MKIANTKLSLLRVTQWVLVAIMFLAGALLYSYLPDMIPTHWNVNNQIDGWTPKIYGAWLIPGMALIFTILFPLLRKIDPESKNYDKFAKTWEVFQITIIGFLAYMYAITSYVALNVDKSYLVGRLVMLGLGVMFIILGNYMGKIRHNYFVGIKTPWTLADPEVWQKTHRLAGWIFVAAGLLVLLMAFFWMQYIWPFFIAIILAIVIIPMFYSYWISRK